MSPVLGCACSGNPAVAVLVIVPCARNDIYMMLAECICPAACLCKNSEGGELRERLDATNQVGFDSACLASPCLIRWLFGYNFA